MVLVKNWSDLSIKGACNGLRCYNGSRFTYEPLRWVEFVVFSVHFSRKWRPTLTATRFSEKTERRFFMGTFCVTWRMPLSEWGWCWHDIRSTWNPDLVSERHTQYFSILRAAYYYIGSVTVSARHVDFRTRLYSIVMWCNEKLSCLMAEKNEILVFFDHKSDWLPSATVMAYHHSWNKCLKFGGSVRAPE